MPKKMTKKKKQERIQELKNVITSFGFIQDKWGNYKLEKDDKKFRFKIKKINIRFEINVDPWLAIFSKRIVKTTPEELTNDLTKRGFKNECINDQKNSSDNAVYNNDCFLTIKPCYY